jgi:phosphatidylglycerophosphate synthase
VTEDLKLVGGVSIAGLIAIALIAAFASPTDAKQWGTVIAVGAAAALLVAFCAERLDDETVDAAQTTRRAKTVEAIAVTIGLPALLLTSGEDLEPWSAAIFLPLLFVLAVVFATTKR